MHKGKDKVNVKHRATKRTGKSAKRKSGGKAKAQDKVRVKVRVRARIKTKPKSKSKLAPRPSSNNNAAVNAAVVKNRPNSTPNGGPRVLIHARIMPDLKAKLDGEITRLQLPTLSALVEKVMEKYFE